jgi:cell division protein FtsB
MRGKIMRGKRRRLLLDMILVSILGYFVYLYFTL